MSLPLSSPAAQRWFTAACGAALTAAFAPACVKRLPPAPPPQPFAPAIDTSTPPASGNGRLVVDVVEGTTRVRRIRMQAEPVDRGEGRVSYQLFESPEILCEATPCVVDVPPGNILLGFPVIGKRSLEVQLVHVGTEPTVYRRSLSVFHRKRRGRLFLFGVLGTAFGGASAMTGVALLPAGLSKDNDGLAKAGAITLAAGALVMTLGIWALRHEASIYRPGSSIHYSLMPPAPGSGQ